MFGGKFGIQRQVGPIGLEDAEHTDHHVRGSPNEEPDYVAAADASTSDGMGQEVGPLIELGVGQLVVGEGDGDGVGRPGRLRLEEPVERRIAGEWPAAAAPLGQDLVTLRGREQLEAIDALVGLRRCPLQQLLITKCQPSRRRRIEQVAVILEHSEQALARVPQDQRQVELRRSAFRLPLAHLEAGQAQAKPWAVLQGERHLANRIAPGVPPRPKLFDQPLKG